MRSKILTFLAFLVPSFLWSEGSSSIDVEVIGLKKTGLLNVALYNSEEGFPMKDEMALQRAQSQVDAETLSFSFNNLAAGDYALSIHHDEDGEGDFDQNFIGIPTEAVGVSNNAKGSFGPPKFKDAKFALGEGEKKKLQIKLKY